MFLAYGVKVTYLKRISFGGFELGIWNEVHTDNSHQMKWNIYSLILTRGGYIMSIYDFTVQKQDGTDQSMAEYQGQVLLIVNTAPGCGLAPQYKELQELYDSYKDNGFVVLDFPCNQF